MQLIVIPKAKFSNIPLESNLNGGFNLRPCRINRRLQVKSTELVEDFFSEKNAYYAVKVVVNVESVDEILERIHSNDSCCSFL